MTQRARWLLACLLFSVLCWDVLLFAIASFASAASPPECRDDVCVMQGPGGRVAAWKLHVQLNDLAGHRFIVPAGATCASACAKPSRCGRACPAACPPPLLLPLPLLGLRLRLL